MSPSEEKVVTNFVLVADALEAIRRGGLCPTTYNTILLFIAFLVGLQKGTILDHNIELEKLSTIVVVDKALETYLQGQPATSTRVRLAWLERKAREASAYLQFLEARKKFIEIAAGESSLSGIIAHLQGGAVEVEAGKYSLRDLTNVIRAIDGKLHS
jgi:hypothetical protein